MHIRDPSFACDCESVFEVQSTKCPNLPSFSAAFYTGNSLNSSQVLSPGSIFPSNSGEGGKDMVLCSSEFGGSPEDQKTLKVYVATKQPAAVTLGSSVIRPPDFPDEQRKSPIHSRTGLMQHYARLKKPSEGHEDRYRGVFSPKCERTFSSSGIRKVLSPHNKPPPRFQSTRPKSKAGTSSPFETQLHTAYLPSLKTLDQKRIVPKKSARSTGGRRLKAQTPEVRLNAYVL